MLIDTIQVQGFRSIADTGVIKLSSMNIVIGKNNSGKSSLLRAVCNMQAGYHASAADLRIGANEAVVSASLATEIGTRLSASHGEVPKNQNLAYQLEINSAGLISGRIFWSNRQAAAHIGQFSSRREHSVIVPVLARRKADRYDETVNQSTGAQVSVSDRGLTSRIFALGAGDHAEGRRFRELRDRILEIPVGTYLTENGQQPGLPLTPDTGISLERMGEGVSGALKLISELASDLPRLYVIEEPETDLHPGALRELLDAVLAAADRGSQFIVSTHSEQVLRHLGSIPKAQVLQARLGEDDDGIPLTEYRPVEGSYARRDALEDLGYEATTPMGWLVLEESTMEQLLSNFIIPTFTPKLVKLRTVSARGAGNVSRSVEDLHRFALYAHLSDSTDRLWAITDGDRAGHDAVQELSRRFPRWPDGHFQAMAAPTLESLYPEQFQPAVAEIGSLRDGRQRREAKGRLLRDVLTWCREDPQSATREFAASARDLIERLKAIERVVDDLPVVV